MKMTGNTILITGPGTESHSKLELLSVLGQQQLTP